MNFAIKQLAFLPGKITYFSWLSPIFQTHFQIKNKLFYYFFIEIFGLGFLIFAHSALQFIIIWKLCFPLKFFEGTKQMVKFRGQIWTVKRIWQLFLMKLTDSFHCSCSRIEILCQHFLNPITFDLRIVNHQSQFCVLYSEKFPVV